MWMFCQSCKTNRKRNIPNNEDEDMEFMLDDDDNWDVDRMKHPDDYDEHHVQYVPYDLTVSQHEALKNWIYNKRYYYSYVIL